MPIHDLYWTAGFLEGEGSFYFPPDGASCRGRAFRIQAVQVEKEPLEKLLQLYGGSVCESKSQVTPTHHLKYQWTLCGPSAVGLAMTLFLLMSRKRRVQITTALKRWKQRPSSPKFTQLFRKTSLVDVVYG